MHNFANKQKFPSYLSVTDLSGNAQLIVQNIFHTSHTHIDFVQKPTDLAYGYKIVVEDPKEKLQQKIYNLRILNPAESTLEDRQTEIRLTQKMSDLGIAPKLYYADPLAGTMGSEYAPTLPTDKVLSYPLLKNLAHALKKLHATDPTPYINLGNHKLDRIFSHATAAAQRPTFEMFALALKAYEALTEILNTKDVGLCHLDLNPTNILWGQIWGQDCMEETMWFGDWGMADQGDVYFDLATIIRGLKLSLTQEKFLLEQYFGAPVNASMEAYRTARLYVMQQVCYLRYAITTFGICQAYDTLPAPQDLPYPLLPVFVFPYEADGAMDKDLARYRMALAFLHTAQAHMSSPKFTEALTILNPQELYHPAITAFGQDAT